jgi:hypothetical protein
MKEAIQDTLGKAKGEEEKDDSAVRKHRSQCTESNRERHPEPVDPPPALTIVARQRVLACPVCKVWSLFEEMKHSRQRKEPNRLTERQPSQQVN